MDNALYVSVHRQSGLLDKLNVLSNNMSNVNSSGFKKRYVEFVENVKNKTDQNESGIAFASVNDTPLDSSVGSFTKTGGNFDFALKDKSAYFGLEVPGQGVAYTRDGSFSIRSDGVLVNSQGYGVMSSDGGAIVIPADAYNISVSGDGSISINNEFLARVGSFDLRNRKAVENIGDSLVAYEGEGVELSSSEVLHGFLEDSNVEPVSEISGLIKAQRAVEQGANLMTLMYDLEKSSVNSLLLKE